MTQAETFNGIRNGTVALAVGCAARILKGAGFTPRQAKSLLAKAMEVVTPATAEELRGPSSTLKLKKGQ